MPERQEMKLVDSFLVGSTLIEVALSDITSADVEVIVNSICDLLHFGGGVSGAVSRAAAIDMETATVEAAKGHSVTPGRVIVTGAGRMRFQYVFHAVSSRCNRGTTAAILRQCALNCLAEARSRNVSSIAFPALGTGEMDFSVEEAAAVLIDAVVGDCASTPGLDRVVFCLLRPDAFTAFFRHAVRRSIALETRSFDEPGRSTASVGRGQSGTNSSQLLAERLRNETSRAVRASLIQDALTRLLVPPLSEPVTPRGNDGDEFCKEFAFPNNSPEGFWKTLDERFGASIVRVISPTGEGFGLDHATELMRKRLRGSPTGRVGLVVVGEMESPTFNRAALEAHRREELLILILDGLDLCQMLELQRTGKRIEPYLEAKVSAFLTSSESGEFVSEVEKPTARRVFVSYAHEDSAHEYMLEKTLRLMHIQGLLTLWHDGRILAGSKWENEICEELDQADIVVCLVSLDFLSSAYCFDKELERALERRSAGAMVVPLVVRPCEWDQTPLAELQAIPHDPNGALVAITQWQDPDLAWHEVAREFRRLLSEGELRS